MDRDEVESLLAARAELGNEMEPALVDSFAAKIIAEVRRQTELERQAMQPSQPVDHKQAMGSQLALGIVSLVMAIPLTAIAMGTGFPWMAVVTWLGIVLVNFAFASRYRGQR